MALFYCLQIVSNKIFIASHRFHPTFICRQCDSLQYCGEFAISRRNYCIIREQMCLNAYFIKLRFSAYWSKRSSNTRYYTFSLSSLQTKILSNFSNLKVFISKTSVNLLKFVIFTFAFRLYGLTVLKSKLNNQFCSFSSSQTLTYLDFVILNLEFPWKMFRFHFFRMMIEKNSKVMYSSN